MTLALAPTTLQIRRIIPGPVGKVFDAWLVREEWQAWIGPEGIQCEVPLLEPRVGGTYSVVMHLANGSIMDVGGAFQVIEPPHRLIFTWGAAGFTDKQSLVTLEFRDLDGKTELTLTQEGLGTVENTAAHEHGWNGALNKLERYVAGETVR
jgi:uncharacterized protein YndB with AHSA1/START domain